MSRRAKLLQDADWQLLDYLRARGGLPNPLADQEALVEATQALGLKLDWMLLNRLVAFEGAQAAGDYVPPALIEVCKGLVRHRGATFSLALDPCAKGGLLITAMIAEGVALRGEGRRGRSGPAIRAASQGLPGHVRVTVQSQPAVVPDDSDDRDEPGVEGPTPYDVSMDLDRGLPPHLEGDHQLDLIVCNPPWNVRDGQTLTRKPRYRQSQHQLLFEASRQLGWNGIDGGGVAVFLMPPKFWFDSEAEQLRQSLAEWGPLRIDAALHLPAGTLPWTTLSSYIVVATCGKDRLPHMEGGQMFVAELDDDPQRTAVVLENLFEGRVGSTLALGARVEAATFSGFPSLVARQEQAKAERAYGDDCCALGDISTSAVRAAKDAATEASLFIRKFDSDKRERASTDLSVLGDDPDRWLMLELDLERAEPEYVAHWLNTPAGKASIRAVAFGSSLRQVRSRDVGRVRVHLPSLDQQRRMLHLISRAREVESVGRSVQQQVSQPGASLESLAQLLPSTSAAETASLEQWFETLPFPLASILRRYRQAEEDPERAVRVLDHFFEAFGVFWATILISSLEQAGEVPGPITRDIRHEIEAKHIHPLDRSSMRTWSFIGGKIAKWFRSQLLPEGKDAEPTMDSLRCLATRKVDVLQALLSKKIVAILERAGRLRNDSRGHGGATSAATAELLLDRYREELSALREVITPAFSVFKLYRMGVNRKQNGVRTYDVDELQGSNSAFLSSKLRLEDEPDFDALVVSADEGRSLTLVPFIVMGLPKDASNACYFYSRKDGEDSARYVSYHQGADAEDHRPEPLEFLGRWQQDPPDFGFDS